MFTFCCLVDLFSLILLHSVSLLTVIFSFHTKLLDDSTFAEKEGSQA